MKKEMKRTMERRLIYLLNIYIYIILNLKACKLWEKVEKKNVQTLLVIIMCIRNQNFSVINTETQYKLFCQ